VKMEAAVVDVAAAEDMAVVAEDTVAVDAPAEVEATVAGATAMEVVMGEEGTAVGTEAAAVDVPAAAEDMAVVAEDMAVVAEDMAVVVEDTVAVDAPAEEADTEVDATTTRSVVVTSQSRRKIVFNLVRQNCRKMRRGLPFSVILSSL